MTMDGPASSLVDQRACALIREQLKQYRMLHLAVDDDDALRSEEHTSELQSLV